MVHWTISFAFGETLLTLNQTQVGARRFDLVLLKRP
jgi:hypothetical protein